MSIDRIKSLIAQVTPQVSGSDNLRNGDIIVTIHPNDKTLLLAGVYANGTILTAQSEDGYVPLEVKNNKEISYFILGRQQLWKRYAAKGFAEITLAALTKKLREISSINLEFVFFAEDITADDCLLVSSKGYVTLGPLSHMFETDSKMDESKSDESVEPLATRVRTFNA